MIGLIRLPRKKLGRLGKFFQKEENWIKYRFHGKNGSACLLGAIKQKYYFFERQFVYRRLNRHIKKNYNFHEYSDPLFNIFHFNDHPSTTYETIRKMVMELGI